VPELLPSLPMVSQPPTAHQLPVTNKAVPSNCHLSDTNLVLKSLANTNLLPVVVNSFKSTATTTCSILDILLRHMAHQTRCITNVITPRFPSGEAMLTLCTDNGTGAPKYEH